jgi:hypothetical protein
MRIRPIATVACGLLSLLVAGCGGEDHDALPKAYLTLLEDTTAALKEIKDVPTAHAVEPKLKDFATRKAKLDEQAKATKLSADEMKKSDEKYVGLMREAAEKMSAEIIRIGTTSPEAAEIVAGAMGMR